MWNGPQKQFICITSDKKNFGKFPFLEKRVNITLICTCTEECVKISLPRSCACRVYQVHMLCDYRVSAITV